MDVDLILVYPSKLVPLPSLVVLDDQGFAVLQL
jgi:hypothetical protein